MNRFTRIGIGLALFFLPALLAADTVYLHNGTIYRDVLAEEQGTSITIFQLGNNQITLDGKKVRLIENSDITWKFVRPISLRPWQKSAIFPGWGQFALHRPAEGTAFAAGFAVLFGGYILTRIEQQSTVHQYGDNSFLAAGLVGSMGASDPVRLGAYFMIKNHYDLLRNEIQSQGTTGNSLLFFAGALYGLNIFHAYRSENRLAFWVGPGRFGASVVVMRF